MCSRFSCSLTFSSLRYSENVDRKVLTTAHNCLCCSSTWLKVPLCAAASEIFQTTVHHLTFTLSDGDFEQKIGDTYSFVVIQIIIRLIENCKKKKKKRNFWLWYTANAFCVEHMKEFAFCCGLAQFASVESLLPRMGNSSIIHHHTEQKAPAQRKTTNESNTHKTEDDETDK